MTTRPAAVLPRAVVVLGCVSLLNDSASEMVTPLLPLFLVATLGAGPAIVGLVEGLAEATASVIKLLSGWLVDRGWSQRRLVIGGYSVSNVVRPLIGLAVAWSAVLLLRFFDRIGKGIRSAPRDAMIADAVSADRRGRAFGFQRSMDHCGAVLGPLLAFALLARGFDTPRVILFSGAVGVLVIALLVFGLRSTEARVRPAAATPLSWRSLDVRLKRLLAACAVLALATTPEAFLVLWAHERGVEAAHIALLWALASFLKMSVAWPAGVLSDRVGRATVLALGWCLRVLLLVLLAWLPAQGAVTWVMFVAYAGSLAVTEAAERSLVGDAAGAEQRGTAFGIYHLISGLFILPGAFLFGVVWQAAGAPAAFGMAALLTALAIAAIWGALGVSSPGATRTQR